MHKKFINMQKHFKTITTHRHQVCKWCFKMGIPWRGLMHDLSKYSKIEFSIYEYYTDGKRSPHDEAREQLGYSPSWLHHYHHNKHHWEFWLDSKNGTSEFIPIKMPYKYVIEMFCDRVGACIVYEGENFTQNSPLNYYNKFCNKILLHEDTRALLEILLETFSFIGPTMFVRWYKEIKKDLRRAYAEGLNK